MGRRFVRIYAMLLNAESNRASSVDKPRIGAVESIETFRPRSGAW